MTQVKTIYTLTFAYFLTIIFEIFQEKSAVPITLFEHVQSSYFTSILFNLFFFGLFIILTLVKYANAMDEQNNFIFDIIILKFFQIIPVLIDLIDLFFIFRQQIENNHLLNLTILLGLLRLMMSLHFIRSKHHSQYKHEQMLLLDLLLYFLINISLLSYTNQNYTRLLRKFVLGFLIFYLNYATLTDTFWIDFSKYHIHTNYTGNQHNSAQLIHTMEDRMKEAFSAVWYTQLFLILLFGYFSIQSIFYHSDEKFSMVFISQFFRTGLAILIVCGLLYAILNWSKSEEENTLHQYGFSCFSLGYDIHAKSTYFYPAQFQTAVDSEITITNSIPTKIKKDSSSNKTSFFSTFFNKTSSFFKRTPSIKIGEAKIEVEKGDITKQTTDVIIGCLSSEKLCQSLLKAAGAQIETNFKQECQTNPDSLVIATSPGNLQCKKILFFRWTPSSDPNILQQSIVDLIWNIIQNVNLYKYKSIAIPAIGCGGHACSVELVVQTMVREVSQQIEKRKLSWTIKFVVHPSQSNVYDEFDRQISSSSYFSTDYQIPSTWVPLKINQIKYIVSEQTNEYKSIISNFDITMKGQYKEILKLERIQNERWYMQYMAHWKDFRRRLNKDTEQRLYHGCSELAANLIIKECFNRSFAGVNGTLYGFGVYFSSKAVYSHSYTKPTWKGERCMFVARVLAGKTTKGNSSMKTPPPGYDSTTDGNHMTVTYHDAQAYAEYLITYK